MDRKCQIYVLRLQHGKYYIGQTTNIKARFAAHRNGKGAEWTCLHKPIEIIECIEGEPLDEEKLTLKYMEKYTINNVRGGSYCQIKLSSEQVEQIQKSLDNASGRCFNCHKTGHMTKACPSEDACFRCGRPGHWAEDCYAKSDVKGNKLEPKKPEEMSGLDTMKTLLSGLMEALGDEETCTRCGRSGHKAMDCYAKTDTAGKRLETDMKREETCFRCGRHGHKSTTCHAKTDAQGKKL